MVEALDGVVEGKHHQQDVSVGEAGVERHVGADEVDRLVDEAEALEHRVDHPGGAEEDAKGEGTQDLVDPERQDEQQDHGARTAALGDLRDVDRKSNRLNYSHYCENRMPSSA